ncbi:MAG: metal-dependent transcriptional regulator [Candidatus Izemoplasmatales bacterium]|nr:metal-dependent transcriptional regulator [Candidatus Izemoplasmatales bacterium]
MIHKSGEDYLERIMMIKERQEIVKAIDVAKEMNYSKPSVSRALKLLAEAGYIEVCGNGNITFTSNGLELAQKIYDRHKFFSDFLMYIGVDEQTAINDACNLEHALSSKSFLAMKEYINKIRENCKEEIF